MVKTDEVTIKVAWPRIDGLKVMRVTAVCASGMLYTLDVLAVTQPVKLTRRKNSTFRLVDEK